MHGYSTSIAIRIKMTSPSPHILALFSASVMVVLLGKTAVCQQNILGDLCSPAGMSEYIGRGMSYIHFK